MRVAITGGTGFIGTHLARRLTAANHAVVLLARGQRDIPTDLRDARGVDTVTGSVDDDDRVRNAVDGADAVAHLAGINYERGDQTYDRVHVRGTKAVVDAAVAADVERVLLTSYLRARPDCGSGYLESKWAAEELVRDADVAGVVLKPAAVFGEGDQLLTHLARAVRTVPVLPRIGLTGRNLRPVAVEDVVDAASVALTIGRLDGMSVPLMGPEELSVEKLGRRMAGVLGRRIVVVPTPPAAMSVGAWLGERLFEPPLFTRAGVRMLDEGMTAAAPAAVCVDAPTNLEPTREPSAERLRAVAADTRRLGLGDLRGRGRSRDQPTVSP